MINSCIICTPVPVEIVVVTPVVVTVEPWWGPIHVVVDMVVVLLITTSWTLVTLAKRNNVSTKNQGIELIHIYILKTNV